MTVSYPKLLVLTTLCNVALRVPIFATLLWFSKTPTFILWEEKWDPKAEVSCFKLGYGQSGFHPTHLASEFISPTARLAQAHHDEQKAILKTKTSTPVMPNWSAVDTGFRVFAAMVPGLSAVLPSQEAFALFMVNGMTGRSPRLCSKPGSESHSYKEQYPRAQGSIQQIRWLFV